MQLVKSMRLVFSTLQSSLKNLNSDIFHADYYWNEWKNNHISVYFWTNIPITCFCCYLQRDLIYIPILLLWTFIILVKIETKFVQESKLQA